MKSEPMSFETIPEGSAVKAVLEKYTNNQYLNQKEDSINNKRLSRKTDLIKPSKDGSGKVLLAIGLISVIVIAYFVWKFSLSEKVREFLNKESDKETMLDKMADSAYSQLSQTV